MRTLQQLLKDNAISNALQVYSAAYNQAQNELGLNIAYWFIQEHREGRELTKEEKVMYVKIQCETYRQRAFEIVNAAYFVLPIGVRNSRLMREYLACKRTAI